MKLTLITLFLCISGLFAETYSQSTRINLSMSNVKTSEIISAIEKQTDYLFVYVEKEVDLDRQATLMSKNQTVEEALSDLFEDSDIVYTLEGKNILLKSKSLNEKQQDQRKVTGIITDEKGEPIVGANIVQKGTSNGTVTDVEGRFTMELPKNATLLVSYIGYEPVEMKVDSRNSYIIKLHEDTESLEEVVVIGYGTTKKKDLTGAVARISSNDFKAQPVQNVSEMLRGNAPGVAVKTNGDGSTVIRVRGSNSLNGDNDPLYVVDGVPMGSYSPNDVESIEILKDASATAIYGSRGANGVILITTKRGSTGDPSVEVTANTSFATYPKYYDLLNGSEFADFYNSYFGRDVKFDKSVDTDWQRALTQTGIRQNYQANVSGGTEKMKFYVGGNYINNQGLIKNQDEQTYRIRSNFDFKLGSKFFARIDVSVLHMRDHGSEITGKSSLLSALQWSPSVPIRKKNGDYTITDPFGITTSMSPYYETIKGNDNHLSTEAVINGYFAYEIISGLKLSVQPSVSLSNLERRRFQEELLTANGKNRALRSTTEETTWQITGLLNYDKVFNSVHNFNAMLGAEVWEESRYFYEATGEGIGRNDFLWNNLGSASIKDMSSSYLGQSLASFFARVNYNYDSKYYLTASVRADGSSKFAKGNRFSYFPSGAVGWVLSKEDFMEDIEWLDFLKLRASYGVTGSQAIKPYATIASLRNRRNWSWGTGNRVQGIELRDPINVDLKWEETTQWDLGFDWMFLNKWSVAVDYYNKKTDGLLTNRVLPLYSGGGSTMINLGEMRNSGIDLSVTYTPFMSKDFSWRMTLNGGFLSNEVVSLGSMGDHFIPSDDANFTGVQLESSPLIVQEGESLGQMYGYKWLGLWKTDEAAEAAKYNQKPGDNKYKDANNNGQYDNGDREVIGNFLPKFTWSYNTTINWKNFDFNLLVEGAHGQDMYNYNRMLAGTVIGLSGSVNLREAAENVWTPQNQNTMWCPNSTSALEKANSSKWVENAGWVKVRNISIGYTIPKQLLKGHEIRVNASVQNALTLTGYSGMDPEAAVNGGYDSDVYGGVEYGTFPSPRIYTIGLTYKFK